MSIHVLLRGCPHRSIAIVTPNHALIFSYTHSNTKTSEKGSSNSLQNRVLNSPSGTTYPHCAVELTTINSIGLSGYQPLSHLSIHGTLGLITIKNDIFLCVVSSASKVATVRPGETVEKISGVNFYCLNNSNFDLPTSESSNPHASDDGPAGVLVGREQPSEHPCTDLQKLLSNGSFYYSTDFDITNRLQNRNAGGKLFDVDNMDESFLWNSYMISPLIKFRSRLLTEEKKALDRSRILISAIRGFALTITIPSISAPLRKIHTGKPSSLTLISRLSCRRAGTRFNSRGIDDDGYVANFVESETIYWTLSSMGNQDNSVNRNPKGVCFSYVQIRGSVPIFWEQAAGIIPGQQKITIIRSPEGSQPAFEKHFSELEHIYGSIHIINLLSETKVGEVDLTSSYRKAVCRAQSKRQIKKSTQDHQGLKVTEYDFHAETKGPSGYQAASLIRKLIETSARIFEYFHSENAPYLNDEMQVNPDSSIVIKSQQRGVFRTNCLDCLDRTNLIQTIISQMAIENFLSCQIDQACAKFWMLHSGLWADNGDALSCIYAGTGALKSSFTRHGKMSFAGAIADARKSATRLYINNFTDKSRQNTIDELLGRLVGQKVVHLFDPINESVITELANKKSSYQKIDTVKIWCGTFNLNGKSSGSDEDLSSWLCPGLDPAQQTPDIVAAGFQEMVELSPQQIMNSDPTRKEAWERAVQKTLNEQAQRNGDDLYLLLRSGQLVGAALMIFVKKSVLENIRNVEGSVKKTGMSGMAGNKGAVAIRMDYANTSLCFVTAHFAAGLENYSDRNNDFNTINYGLRFLRNRSIDDHDTIVWMGDFNYRIELGLEKVRQLIKAGDLDALYEKDQLNVQMIAGLTFPFYSESRITFMPTYKFDLGQDVYDTSEKARIPAWTDRILRKGLNIRQVNYNTSPLRFSDHRPVYATFLCTVNIVDEARREALSRDIYEKQRTQAGMTLVNIQGNEDDNRPLNEDGSPGIKLPPASSDVRKWWLDMNQPIRSQIAPPSVGMAPNPNRPSNPYSYTDEQDWVSISGAANIHALDSIPVSPLYRTTTLPLTPDDQTCNLLQTKKCLSPQSSHRQILSPNLPKESAKLEMRPKPLIQHSSSDYLVSNSTTEHDSAQKYRTPPPIARKPIHLTSQQKQANSAPIKSASTDFSKSLSCGANKNLSSSDKVASGDLLREDRERFLPQISVRNTPVTPVNSNKIERIKSHHHVPEKKVVVDILGNDDEMSVGGWKALVPQ
ncbi:BgTH12-00034 [Blumeria graminis f. sp. triticale]|uniref:phosphoinositide 5-phosphatase n=1 Tax=Blumeria graminis f. sp. triticale TaxID=1689686 RepID=A0A9W4DMI4_BLUGR|nr:BgTH12-00034 [Blumeria graminis f. sp. triticale]